MERMRAFKGASRAQKNIIIVTALLLFAVLLAVLVMLFTEKDGDGVLKYEMLDGGTYAVVGVFSYDAERIEIPEYYRGAPVSAVGEGAFRDCAKLSEIKIPESVKTVGDYAFSGCVSLKEIDLSGAEGIGFAVFESCSSLRKISLPFLEFHLGYLFGESDGITNESVPDSLKEVALRGGNISERAFFSCRNIEKISLGALVTEISGGAFEYCEKLQAISIPDSVSLLGERAFYECTGLKSAIINAPVVNISEDMFSGCLSLSSIELPHTLEGIDDRAFYNCKILTELDFPESLVRIGESAFYACSEIENLNFPDSLEIIGDGAFKNCPALKNTVIPDGVKTLGFGAFEGCSALEGITVPFVGKDGGAEDAHFGYIFGGKIPEALVSVTVSRAEILYEGAFKDCNKIKTVILPGGINKISARAFSGCAALERISLPKELLTVDDELFLACSSLKEVIFGDKLTSIGKNAFDGCVALEKFDGPLSLKEIGEGAFKSCTALTAVTLPPELTRIGKGAFSACLNLEILNYNSVRIEGIDAFDYIFEGAGALGDGIRVNIGKDVEIIPAYLFCTVGGELAPNLCAVSFSEGASLTEIGAYAFAYTQLPRILIPKSVAVIGDYAFRFCNRLVIDCELASKPQGWREYWNASNCQINWAENPVLTYSFVTGGAGEIDSISSVDAIMLPEPKREGFVFLGWCENEALNGVLYRGEYKSGSDVTLYAVWQSEECDGSSFEMALYLKEGEEYALTVEPGETVYFKFVPDTSGVYTFKSLGNRDTYGILYDGEENEIRSHDGERDFQIDILLSAGKTYYLAVKLYSPLECGEFVVAVE